MSEGAMEGPQKLGPREIAIQYILERDAKRRQRIKLPGFGDRRTHDTEVEIAAATAYERVFKKLGEGGGKRAMDMLRPVAYDMAKLYRYGAKFADMFVTGAFLLAPGFLPGRLQTSRLGTTWWGRLLGAGATMKFRPIEWAAKTVADVGGVATAEGIGLVNKVVDNISGVKQPETRPT